MAVEIERKFLVESEAWRAEADGGQEIRQGYLVAERERSVRVRLRAGRGTLTIKGEARGAVRSEFEYEIPAKDAAGLLDEIALTPLIEKTRYLVRIGDATFEIDVFSGDNAGLVVAEIELEDEDAAFPRPAWLGEEVTDDPRYLNAMLFRHPYSQW